ncbi:P-loop containing nucleoside triphosphate hydrolase protein [Neolentinus lepideus HHB14362 ss-1]|uniref:p-loop containing nucleoside triphosphate hydrolase protein n=1 Tax=Neolentinus lepideus HHB14362 ss-1 TaxID=1314782 RepID=A0A165VP63_9AGAM|nr:P-loop containing nucleoside triphosphate hydrolase protein [Neolentinus lepideus HHB14362 ss-1]
MAEASAKASEGATVPRNIGGIKAPAHLGSDDRDSLFGTLSKPLPYTVLVENLSVEAPVPGIPLPLPIPVRLPPKLARRSLGEKYRSYTGSRSLLLRDVSLESHSGEILAIIGSSGSGKTTLLHALAQKTSRLKTVAGTVSFRPASSNNDRSEHLGNPRNESLPRKLGGVIGFVRQDDFLLPCLTVRETLRFAAYLRLPASISSSAREAIVEKTILELGLKDAANTIVGGPLRKGISGGERRRLSMGCILVTLPSVLVLDEPTTGLDTTAAYHLLSLLSSLARRGRTVIISIHQPRSDAYLLFDRICLLARGSVVYSGPRADALPWFAKLGFEAPPRINPLDFLIDISAIDTRDEESEARTEEQVNNLIKRWKDFSEKAAKSCSRPTYIDGHDEQPVILGRGHSNDLNKRPSLLMQTRVLSQRGFLNVYRDYGQLLGFLLQVSLMGVATGLTFYKPPETPAGIQTLKTVYYQGQVAFFYLSIVIYIFILCNNLVIFDREREDHLYSVVPYVLSNFLAFLPINVMGPTLYAIIIYFMCGFRKDNLARYLFICILQQLASFAYALFAGSMARPFAEASLLANGLSIMFVLSAGYIIVNLPAYIGWTRWLSPYFYGFRWVAISQFKGKEFSCSGFEGSARNQCTGDNVLRGLRFNLDTPIWVYPLGIVAFILVVLMISTFLLQYYHPGGVRHAAKQIGKESDTLRAEKVAEAISSPKRDPVQVELRDLKLDVHLRDWLGRQTRKTILSDISAVFRPGKVSVILGPSGAGKSSLLEVISGHLTTGIFSKFEISGDVLFNAEAMSETTKGLVAFVQQNDSYLLPALTIRETLHYAARLHLRGMPRKAKIQRAEEVLRMMGLRPVADNIVGGETVKGISGGEKRRLSLAIQLMSDPSVLICDEPTSGLDAFTALSIMDALRNIATSGRTVIVTIHQPRSEIWATSFDDVLLLCNGRIVYTGPKDRLLPTLEAAGEVAPLFYNPADFALDVISIDRRDEIARKETTARVEKLLDSWKSSAGVKGLEEHKVDLESARPQSIQEKGDDASHQESVFFALPIVLSRSWTNLRRQQDVFVARLANSPFLALLFWLFFLRLTKGASGAQDRVGLLIENSAMPFVGMLASIAVYPAERDAFYREYKNPTSRYSAATFILSYSIQEIPMQVAAAMLYSIIMLAGMNLQLDARIYFEYVTGIFGLLNFGESIGSLHSGWVINGGLSVSIVSSALTILSQTSGIVSATLPKWLQIIGWASALTYQARVAFINEFTGLQFHCTEDEISSGECLAVSGEQMIETFGFKDRNTAKFTGLLLVLITIYRLLAFLAVRLRVALF